MFTSDKKSGLTVEERLSPISNTEVVWIIWSGNSFLLSSKNQIEWETGAWFNHVPILNGHAVFESQESHVIIEQLAYKRGEREEYFWLLWNDAKNLMIASSNNRHTWQIGGWFANTKYCKSIPFKGTTSTIERILVDKPTSRDRVAAYLKATK
jgi:hypothetical protein